MADSAILERARKLWPAKPDAPELAPLLNAWAEFQDAACPATLDEWCGVMRGQPDGDLIVILCARDAALRAAQTAPGLQDETAKCLVALLLVAAECRVCRQAGDSAELRALSRRLSSVDEPLAAQVVAACLSGRGLVFEASAEGDHPEATPINVIEALPAEVLAQRTARDALRLEVQLHLAALRSPDGRSGLRQRRQQVRQRVTQLRSDAAVKLEVDQFRRRHNAGLMVVAEARCALPALHDPEVIRYAEDALGVGVFTYGPPAPGSRAVAEAAPPDDVWAGVVADVAEPLREAIGALFPRAPTRAAQTGQADPPQVFLSYAHAPGDAALVQAVEEMLKVLAKQGHIRLWIDKINIGTGQAFSPDIQKGISTSRLALVLVSPALMKSDYIQDHELPCILKHRDAGSLIFFPFALRDSDLGASPHFAETNFKLSIAPLGGMTPAGQDAHLAKLSAMLRDLLAGRAV